MKNSTNSSLRLTPWKLNNQVHLILVIMQCYLPSKTSTLIRKVKRTQTSFLKDLTKNPLKTPSATIAVPLSKANKNHNNPIIVIENNGLLQLKNP